MAEPTVKSWRYGVEPKVQGVGWIENTGDDWVQPESRSHGIKIFDDDHLPHNLILCCKDGKIYDIMRREGPSGSGVSKIWKDKVFTDGTGGTDVVPVLWLPEDVGEIEHFYMGGLQENIYVRPYSETTGYPAGLEIGIEVYEDGNPTTYTARAEKLPTAGVSCWDKIVDARRLQTKIFANMGEHIISGRSAYFVADDSYPGGANLVTSEMDYQAEFAEPQLWLAIILGQLSNRADGATISGTYAAVASPDGNTNGLRIAAALTLSSVTLGATGCLLVWSNSAYNAGTLAATQIAMTIGGDAVALYVQNTTAVDGYYLYAASAINKTGAVVITPTGNRDIFDVRAFNSAISADALVYYYNDFSLNDGKNFLPN